MSSGIQAFKQRMGEPAPPAETPLTFEAPWAQSIWSFFAEEAGTGYFLNGFVYLLGARARELDGLLDEWSFLFGNDEERWVIGKNAYGALLVLENPSENGTKGLVGMVDPLEVRYVTNSQLTFISLLGRWLPQDLLPHFLDDYLYQTLRKEADEDLAFNEILAIKSPLSLGGKMEAANFQVENIFDYYRTTGEIYAKRFDDDDAR